MGGASYNIEGILHRTLLRIFVPSNELEMLLDDASPSEAFGGRPSKELELLLDDASTSDGLPLWRLGLGVFLT